MNIKQVSIGRHYVERKCVIWVTVTSLHLANDSARESIHAGADVDGEVSNLWWIDTVIDDMDSDMGVRVQWWCAAVKNSHCQPILLLYLIMTQSRCNDE